MTQIAEKKKYKAMFILDTRGYEDGIETIIDRVNAAIKKVGGGSENVDNLGRMDFVRITDKNHPGDFYIQILIDGPVSLVQDLNNELHLDKQIKRIFITEEK